MHTLVLSSLALASAFMPRSSADAPAAAPAADGPAPAPASTPSPAWEMPAEWRPNSDLDPDMSSNEREYCWCPCDAADAPEPAMGPWSDDMVPQSAPRRGYGQYGYGYGDADEPWGMDVPDTPDAITPADAPTGMCLDLCPCPEGPAGAPMDTPAGAAADAPAPAPAGSPAGAPAVAPMSSFPPPYMPSTTIHWNWQLKSEPDVECNATDSSRDRLDGFCGDEWAVQLYTSSCIKTLKNADGTEEPLDYDRETDSQLQEARSTAINESRFTEEEYDAYFDQTLGEPESNRVRDAIKDLLPTFGCLPDEEPKRAVKCAERPCEELELQTKTVGDCFSPRNLPCGPLKKQVEKLCWSKTYSVYLTPGQVPNNTETACSGATLGFSLEDCATVEECAGTFYQYSPWTSCSASCDNTWADGERYKVVSGEQTRTAACISASTEGNEVTTTPADGQCPEDPQALTQACSIKCTKPLVFYKKTVGDCTATVENCGNTGDITTTYALCDPATETGCVPHVDRPSPLSTSTPCPAVPCDPCASNQCVVDNTKGTEKSADGKACSCICKEGWAGSRCHREESAGPLPVLDKNGVPCSSAVLDRERNCCADSIDGCGYCKGAARSGLDNYRVGFDIAAECCSGTTSNVFLTGDFTCCPGLNALDECGVCNGSGSTCKKACKASPNFASAITTAAGFLDAKRDFGRAMKEWLAGGITLLVKDAADNDVDVEDASRRLLAVSNVEYTVLPTAAVSAGQLSSSYTVTGGTRTDLVQDPGTPTPSVVGEADNGVCENGEPSGSRDCITPQDCPSPSVAGDFFIGNPALTCSGNGVCNRVTGACVCGQGYIGDACETCDLANGYADVPTATDGQYACTRLTSDFTDNGADGPEPAASPPPPGTSPTPSEQRGGIGAGAIAGAAIGATAGVAVIGGGAYYLMRKRGAQPIASSGQQV